jgi:hypothetical protein
MKLTEIKVHCQAQIPQAHYDFSHLKMVYMKVNKFDIFNKIKYIS